MRICPLSRSDAVTQTLEAVIVAAGHTVAPHQEAEWLLVDTLHPVRALPAGLPTLTLGHDAQNDAFRVPIAPRQLIRQLHHRLSAQPVALAQGWSLDTSGRSLSHPTAGAIPLTEKEAALLAALAASPAPIPRDTLLTDVWGMRGAIDTHTLETHIYRLRTKLEALSPSPGTIVTTDGAYRFSIN